MNLEKLKKYSKPLLRISLSLLFLYFAFQQFSSPDNWTSFIPSFVLTFGITAKTLVLANAFLELSLGILMLVGLYTRFASLILALHLFGIAFSIGLNPLGIRDAGLAIATLTVFMNGPDYLCLDRKFQNKKFINKN